MSISKRADYYWRVLVKAKADYKCEICGIRGSLELPCESHHIFFGALKSDPRYRYDPDFGICLCNHHHYHSESAPHVDKNKFFDMMMVHLRAKNPMKAMKIREAWEDRFKESLFKPKPDYKAIIKSLKAEIKQFE